MGTNAIREAFNPLETPSEDPNLRDYLRANIRNDVREIVRSYHQTYDHLQELLQNAVDACENTFMMYKQGKLRGSYQPYIGITFNLSDNSVTVTDNGIGMSKQDLTSYFFMPHATLKDRQTVSHARVRGEKGVGATFLSFGSAGIRVASKSQIGEMSSCRLEGGIEWVLSNDSLEPPRAHPSDCPSELEDLPHGTIVTVAFNRNTNMKSLRRHGPDLDHWERILRVYTAIGWVLPLGEKDAFFTALVLKLKMVNEEGEKSLHIGGGYLYPHQIEGVTSERLSSLSRGPKGRLSPSQKLKDCLWEFYSFAEIREKARERITPAVLEVLEKHRPTVYMAFVWSREFWDEVNRRCFTTGRKEFGYGLLFSTKTQQIGERRQLSFTWRSGDYNRIFVLFDVKNLHADIGRKSIPGDLRELGGQIANLLHEGFTNNSDALKRESVGTSEREALELEELTNMILRYPELKGAEQLGLQLTKIPHEEQDVLALFFDLLGAGWIKGYKVLATKTSTTYDSFAKFSLARDEKTVYHPSDNPLGIPSEKFGEDGTKRSPERSLMEFKLSSDGLIRDILHEDKRLSDIRWLVCWQIGSLHTHEDFDVLDIVKQDRKDYREYYGLTHLLTDGQTSVYVICLKQVMEVLRKLQTR